MTETQTEKKQPTPAARRKFEVAPGKSLTHGPRVADKWKAGDVVELTSAEFKQYPKGSFVPYVDDMDDKDA